MGSPIVERYVTKLVSAELLQCDNTFLFSFALLFSGLRVTSCLWGAKNNTAAGEIRVKYFVGQAP